MELLWYEWWLSSVPFIDKHISMHFLKQIALLHDSGKGREIPACTRHGCSHVCGVD